MTTMSATRHDEEVWVPLPRISKLFFTGPPQTGFDFYRNGVKGAEGLLHLQDYAAVTALA